MPKVLDPYHRWLGIPPKDQPPNHYRLLGIERFEPDQEVIRDAAEQRMAHVRTYQLGQYSELSQKILNELAAAKACLLDPQKKAVYDRQLRALAGKLGAIEDAALPLPASRPALPEKRPLTKRVPRRNAARWVLPTAIGGGIALLAAGVGVALVLAPNPADRKVARATDARKAVQPQNTTPPQTKPVVPEAKGFAPQPANSPVAVQPRPGRTPPDAAVQPRSDAGRQPTAEQSPPLPPDSREEPQEEPQSEPEKPKVAARKQPKKKPAATHAAKNGSRAANGKTPSLNDEVRPWLPITLPSPSRATVTESMLSVPKKWQDTLFPKTANVFPCLDNSGKLIGVFTHAGVKLNGAAATLHQNGHLESLVTSYSKGLVDGCVKLWDQDGKQILCAEYQRGKKHGVLCFSQNGVPWLIQECDKGQPQGEYLVKWTENGPRVLSMAERTDDDNEEMSKASQQLADLEQKMKNNEKELKKKLANWVAGCANKGKLNRMLDQIHGRNAAKAAESNAFWRRTLEHSGL